MGHRCNILGCGSISEAFAVSAENKNEIIRFSLIPRKESIRNKWLQAIGDKLRIGKGKGKKLYVCEKHFTKDCFRSDNFFIWKDGVKVEMSRKKCSLKKGSVPSIFPKVNKFIKMSPRKRKLSPDSEERLAIASRILDIQENCPVVFPSTTAFCENSQKDTSQRSMIKSDINRNLFNIQNTKDTSEMSYSINDLKQEWNQRNADVFPLRWEMQETDEELVFFNYGTDLKMICSIFVTIEMYIEIRVYDYISNYKIIDKVRCLEDLRYTMCVISSLKICAGAEKGLCKSGFFNNSHVNSETCDTCQIIFEREKMKKKLLRKKLKDKSKKRIFIDEDERNQSEEFVNEEFILPN